jgi:hypothetical protein
MGLSFVEGRVRGPAGEEVVRFLVDSGASYSLLPDGVWQRIGLGPKRTVTFTLADGTTWRADIPENWNGTVFTDLDHVPALPTLPVSAWKRYLLESGYAFIGTERNTVAYNYGQAIDNQVETLGEFEDMVGRTADLVIASRGFPGGILGG